MNALNVREVIVL